MQIMISHLPFLINRKEDTQANELRQRIYPQLTSSDYLRFDFTSEWAKIADEILPAWTGKRWIEQIKQWLPEAMEYYRFSSNL